MNGQGCQKFLNLISSIIFIVLLNIFSLKIEIFYTKIFERSTKFYEIFHQLKK